MKNTHIFFVLCFITHILSAQSAFCQRNTSEGFIINNEGDTIPGRIFMHNESKAGTLCTFYRTGSSDPVKFKPEEIKGFRYSGGKYFVSREIELNGRTQKLFLEYLIRGKASIYYLKSGAEHYFIETAQGRIVELTEPQLIIHTDSGAFITQGHYKGKLLAIMNDCPNIAKQVNATNLNHHSLIRVAKSYHEQVCADESCIIYERESHGFKLLTGVTAGPVFSSINFGNALRSNFGPGYTLGGKLELISGLNNFRNGSFQADLIFQRNIRSSLAFIGNGQSESVYYEGTKYIVNPDTTNYLYSSFKYVQSLDVKWKTTMVKLPLSVNFYQWGSKLQVMAGLGTSIMYVLYQNKDFVHPVFDAYFHQSIPSFFVGFQGKTGIRYRLHENNFLALNMGYEYLTTTNINEILRVKLNTISCRLEYTF